MIDEIKNNKYVRVLLYPIILLRRIYFRIKNRRTATFNYLFSNVKQGSIILNIKEIRGDFEIDVRSDLLKRILIEKSYEPLIIDLIKKNIDRERDAINVGANIGIFTVLIAQLINKNKKVLAIEPTPLAFNYLGKNINRNLLNEKVILFNGICSDKKGTYWLNTIAGKEEYSSLGKSIYISQTKTYTTKLQVEGETVDNLVSRFKLDPGLILIDV